MASSIFDGKTPAPPPAAGNGSAGGYDRVKVPGEGGQFRILSRTEFENLPLNERVKHLLGGKLVFFRDGAEIPARDALRSV